jgi:uncharacterized membrane protein required for colicin V production
MWYDGYVAALVAAGVAAGAWAGLSRQLSLYASIVLGVALGVPLTDALARSLDVAPIFLFFGCYAAIALACHLGGVLLQSAMKQARLSLYDHHMGALVGAAQGLALSILGLVLMANLYEDAAPDIRSRVSGRIATRALAEIREILPPDVCRALDPYLRKLEPPPKS